MPEEPEDFLDEIARDRGPDFPAMVEDALQRRSGWASVTYACETCGNRYTTRVYAGLARPELGEGRRQGHEPGETVPTQAATCTADGGRLRLVTS